MAVKSIEKRRGETYFEYKFLGEVLGAKQKEPSVVSECDGEKTTAKVNFWLRGLLDLSQKNSLINFKITKDCLRVPVTDVGRFFCCIRGKSFRLIPGGESGKAFDKELADGVMRCIVKADDFNDAVGALIRKARKSEEQFGTETLYLALGFLKWKTCENKEIRAPLGIVSAHLSYSKKSGAILKLEREYEPNTALFEFLFKQFGLDLRGVFCGGSAVEDFLNAVREKTKGLKDFAICVDGYIAQFAFARFSLWADVKNNIDEFKKNPLILNLLKEVADRGVNNLTASVDDECDARQIFLPLPCDSAQFSAVSESVKGTSFVLHGPPGTGKSRTITNIIANAVASGKRVLFVAEKQAALRVVKNRLCDIGIGEFCLELYSGKTSDKSEIIGAIENTLHLKEDFGDVDFECAAERLLKKRDELRAPFEALHKKREIGVSLYEGIVGYFENSNAPDVARISNSFLDGLTKDKLAKCENLLRSAQAAAKECGAVRCSPFKNVTISNCDEHTVKAILVSCEAVLAELKHLKGRLKIFLDCYGQRVERLAYKKLVGLITICNALKEERLAELFSFGDALTELYFASRDYDKKVADWLENFKTLPDVSGCGDVLGELDEWGQNYRSSRIVRAALKRLYCCGDIRPESEVARLRQAVELDAAREYLLKNSLSSRFTSFSGINERKRREFLNPLYEFNELCADVFSNYDAKAFMGACIKFGNALNPVQTGFVNAAVSFVRSADNYFKIIGKDGSSFSAEDIFDDFSKKCAAVIGNIDLLPAWCKYRASINALDESGLSFIAGAIEGGKMSGAQILSSFKKSVYRSFIESAILSDDAFSGFSTKAVSENTAEFKRCVDELTLLSRKKIRKKLISGLSALNTQGELALDLSTFRRRIKDSRNFKLKDLFYEIPALLKIVAPCVLMSPSAVSQYLPAGETFDLVIFDEASQIPTCEAIPALARAKSAIIVGDPNQLPPSAFFEGETDDEEDGEGDGAKSVLDECLALGMPEKRLVWHYRSKHESLIAFSNAAYYSGRLCTFPSPDAEQSRVKLKLVDGVYERGGAKCNRAEAAAIVCELVARLKQSGRHKSFGVVTFGAAQQSLIEKMLAREIEKNDLEEIAYGGEEPLFIRNLENVQGDERDVIFFSVCYGRNAKGRLSLNFGPLNRYGGWRRLNVAVSRAREEMLVFSSMSSSMIDLKRAASRGVIELKNFLEFAEGRAKRAVCVDGTSERLGIGKFVADALAAYGYECRLNVGESDFKIDVAVVDPNDKTKYALAVLIDRCDNFSFKDKFVLQEDGLSRCGWVVYRLYSLGFFNNAKREIKKLRQILAAYKLRHSSSRLPDDNPIDTFFMAK